MDNFFIQALLEILNFQSIVLIIIGTIFGIIAGAIPGFTVTMGILIALPFTFAMNPIDGLALMMGVFVGGYSGGLVSAIMLGIPGTPSAITTVYDGHPMAVKGQPGRALGIGIFSSFFGTIISIILLATIGPFVAKFALNFGPWEVTAMIAFALTLVASLSSGALLKGLIGGVVGLLIATVGIDINARVRFDFGLDAMAAGFSTLAVMIGLFAFSQVMRDIEKMVDSRSSNTKEAVDNKVKIPYLFILKDMWKQKFNVIRSSLIGVFIGILPGAGGDVANFVSYDQARKASKHPEKFGSGIPEGIVAAESSNNATAGGSLIPTLTLGIPGDMAMAIMMGVLILHGITPGPLLFQNEPVLVGTIYVSLAIAAIVMLCSMLFLIRLFANIAAVPVSTLVPIVIMLCVVGSFTLNRNIFDIWSLFVFGIIGYLLVKGDIPISPLVLGVILGQNFEHNLFRALELNPSILTFFTRPISAIIILFAVLSVVYSLYQDRKIKKQYMLNQQMDDKEDVI